MGRDTLILYDADILVYQIGFSAQQVLDFEEWAFPVGDKKLAGGLLKNEVRKLRKRFGKAKVIFCLSDPEKNFRKKILPTYKGNRGLGGQRPLLFDWIRAWFSEHGHVECWPTLEADDVMGILATREGGTIVSVDKDMKCVPCTLVNPTTWEAEEVTEEAADRFHLFQTLTGDAVDNYKGLPGVGPVKAEKILVEGTWKEVLNAYKAAGLKRKDALVQARVARILRDTDYDGKVKLWKPSRS
jgi:DNA polymerase-1